MQKNRKKGVRMSDRIREVQVDKVIMANMVFAAFFFCATCL